jgi:hypothetical protein
MPEHAKAEPDMRATELELGNLRHIEAVVGHAINLLHDAANLAEHVAHETAPLLRSHGEPLKENVLPIVRREVARLEKKVREG